MKLSKFLLIIIVVITIPLVSIADEYSIDEYTENSNLIEVSSDTSNIPNINARYAIVFDRASKTTLYGKNENTICKMASTTKILTSIVVLEHCSDLNEEVVVSKKAARYKGFQIRTFKR